MKIVAPTMADLLWLSHRLRDDEQDQFSAMTGAPFDADAFARTLVSLRGPSWLALGRDDFPVCAGGFVPVGAGILRPWMAGTGDGWLAHGGALSRFAIRAANAIFADGARRIEAYVLPSRVCAIRWYERAIGMQLEGVAKAWYADGRDAMVFARCRP